MYERNPTSWKPGWTLERALTVMMVLGVVLCIVRADGAVPAETEILPFTAEFPDNQSPAKDVQDVSSQACNDDVCLTPECIKAASIIVENMDPDVDPCDDFYRFACGGYLKSSIVPHKREFVSAMTTLDDKVKDQLRQSLEEPIQPNEPKPFRLVKTLYKSCMNETALEDQGVKPLRKIIEKVGGWPVLDGELWKEADFDWMTLTYKLREVGYTVRYLMTFQLDKYDLNTSRSLLILDTPQFPLLHGAMVEGINNTNVKAYYDYMVDMAVFLGVERERASSELMESLLFEIELRKISLSTLQRLRNMHEYHIMTINELANNYTSIPWKEYFSKLMPKNIKLEDDDIVNVFVPSYFSNLEKLLSKTPKRVLANYLIWKAVDNSVQYLNYDIRNRELAFLDATGVNARFENRLRYCIDVIAKKLPTASSALYMRRYSNKDVNSHVRKMATAIKERFYDFLRQVDWMKEDVQKRFIETIEKMFVAIGNPDEFLDDTKLEKLYENLELSGGTYLDTMLNLTYFDTQSRLGKLREVRNDYNWFNSYAYAASGAASYHNPSGSIHVPTGVLQDPLFSFNRPEYLNYGNIGFTIGKYMAYSFRFMIFQFRQLGYMERSGNHKYEQKMQCVASQYDNYTVEDVGLKVDGRETRFYNIADNTGIKSAYLAYDEWAKKNQPEQKLPGLSYSPNQMFWISATIPYCTKYTSEGLKDVIKTKDFSPAQFRIVGSLSNIPEFSRDFSCPIGSKMNPEKKCSVWYTSTSEPGSSS